MCRLRNQTKVSDTFLQTTLFRTYLRVWKDFGFGRCVTDRVSFVAHSHRRQRHNSSPWEIWVRFYTHPHALTPLLLPVPENGLEPETSRLRDGTVGPLVVQDI